ncbi:MAG TPA: MFS transporter [Longimicrobium sp.]|jgi:MFS family permease|nr:MFS transporter [Longimicrobium sp.]
MTVPQTQTPPADGWRTFFLIWLANTVSTVGSGLTGFVLGFWVYRQTGSATQFALIAACSTLPAILLLPFAGAVVDRRDRRMVMILADLGSAICTGALAVLYASGALQVWHIWLATALSSACAAFMLPANASITPLLVPKAQLGRANGLVQTGNALGIIAPVIAGFLIGLVGVAGVMVVDLVTFFFAAAVFLAVRVPRPAASAEGARARGSIFRQALFGWGYLRRHRALFWLMMLFGLSNFFVSMVSVLVMPLILSFTSVAVAGVLYGCGGAGMVAGGLAMSAWGGPKRRIHGVLGFMALGGVALILHSLAPSPLLIAFAAPLFLSTVPVVGGSSTSILQARVPGDVLGRVFATASMLARLSAPLAYFLAGPLADRVFEPAMAPGGALAGSFGRLIGTGEGRGIALMFMVSGVACMAAAGAGWLSPRLRHVEDVEPEPAPPPPPVAAGPVPAGVEAAG